LEDSAWDAVPDGRGRGGGGNGCGCQERTEDGLVAVERLTNPLIERAPLHLAFKLLYQLFPSNHIQMIRTDIATFWQNRTERNINARQRIVDNKTR